MSTATRVARLRAIRAVVSVQTATAVYPFVERRATGVIDKTYR
jgi:hypothetical protein